MTQDGKSPHPPLPLVGGQRQRFIDVARAIGADEDEAAFKAKLARIARQKPKVDPAPKGSVAAQPKR